ncbi:amino acid deaminase/aldolase [Cytobacillus sp. IB215316]|uniref:amino acid deaminase/aldolase n=1 Tax=Cytobacillus sp. IB215316 TaxID=3097354 RepID=UPI002A0E2CFE|nr:amino acid deaminase/aldolase [Cytobacillus sp. IB215316]MDX8360810.1 amino acid deaminase/aldolase [Cytobacillus sp. IB215316]
MNYQYYKDTLQHIQKPFAYIDLDLLDDNITEILKASNGKKIRLGSKSIRSVPIMKRIIESNEQFEGIMCFTANEAIFLANYGFNDVLIAYPVVDQSYLTAIAEQVKQGFLITLMVDSVEHVKLIDQVGATYNVVIPICIDVDMSVDFPRFRFGVYRSPLQSAKHVDDIGQVIKKCQYVKLDGIMGYEAQVAGVGDAVAGKSAKNFIVRKLKSHSIQAISERRAEVVKRVEDLGFSLRFVNGGGTGSLSSTCKEHVVTEVTVGSGFFSPSLFDSYQDFQYKPAAGYALEIVRTPKDRYYTCLGGGYIASGAVGNDKIPKPYLPSGARLHALEGAGEVQTPVFYEGSEPLSLGDPIFFRHAKSGELCERFSCLYGISQGEIVGEYATYRGEGQCFL